MWCRRTVAQFTYVIRKRIKLSAEQALWVFVETEENGKKSQVLPPTRYVCFPGSRRSRVCDADK